MSQSSLVVGLTNKSDIMRLMVKVFSAETCLGSSNPGTQKGPKVLLEHSLLAGLDHNKYKHEILPPIKDKPGLVNSKNEWPHNYAALVDLNKRLYQQIITNCSLDDIALTLGGDHSISAATLFASKLRFEDVVVVYIDAHPDCTSPDNSLSGNMHGMQLATVMGDSLYKDFNYPQYDYKEVFLIGIKDIDPAEREYLYSNHILHIHMDEIIANGIAACLKKITKHINSRPVHVSLDIDSIDTTEAPGTGIINKGGLSYREVSYLARHLGDQKIVAIDLVEVNPDRDKNNKTVNLGSELVVNLLGGEWSPYTQYMNLQSKH